MRILSSTGVRSFSAVMLLALATATASSQPPTLNPIFPTGVQRGTTIDLNLAGANLAGPTGLLLSFPAKVTIPSENNNGTDNAKLLVRLEVPKDAPLGWHTMRVATTRGVSNFRLFCVDDLPQIVEANDNHTLATAQAVNVPSVICGRADPEQTDYFKFTAAAGQRLAFELLGRRLGSGIDPVLFLLNPRTGRQLAMSDDAPGQSKDPRLIYTFKEAGEYVVELRDVRHQGGGDWYYRLRIGDFPCATTPVPLAAKRGSTVKVEFAGPSVENVPSQTIQVPASADVNTLWVTPTRPNSPPGWPVPLAVIDADETSENEPNDDPMKPARVNVPATISGRLQKKYDRDHYVFTAKKGQKLLIEAQTQELNSPSALYLVIKDAKGAQAAASNPANDPTRIEFTPPEDGDFTLVVEHLHYWGGPEETYRISIAPPEPGFTLTASTDRLDVPQGASAIANLTVTRRDYTGPIEVNVVSPPQVTGKTTIPGGQNAAMLALTSAGDAPVGGHRLVLEARATINNKPVVTHASVLTLVQQSLGNLPFPPRHLAEELAVGITEKPPITLTAKYETAEGFRGGSIPVTFTAAKAPGFDEEITVTSAGLPPAQGQQPAIPVLTVKIPKGQTEAKGELKPAANAPLGELPLAFTAKTKFNNKDYAVATPVAPVNLVLPFELKLSAGSGDAQPAGGLAIGPRTPSVGHVLDLLTMRPQPVVGTLDLSFLKLNGGKHKLKVAAVRKGGYKGPITLEVRNLPANVTATKPTIAENQSEAEIELTIPANAAVGAKADVNVLGTATGAANQQSATANFTLNVVKK